MAANGFEDWEPIFGEAKAEWEQEGASAPPSPLLFYVGAVGPSRLQIVATDFHSLAWDRVLKVSELEDLRDDIGIGGTWYEFVGYLKSSLSTGEIKLILNGQPKFDSDVAGARLIAVKSKGLPRISFSLNKLLSSTANDAIAKFSLALYKAFKNKHKIALKEQEHSSELMALLSAEREKNDFLQKQIDSLSFLSKRKSPMEKLSGQAPDASDIITNADQALVSEIQKPSEVSPSKDSHSTKLSKRVAPVSRRARVRGVSLQDTGDIGGS